MNMSIISEHNYCCRTRSYFYFLYLFFIKNKIYVHLMNVKKNTIYGLKHIDKTQFSLYSHYFFTFTLYFDKNGLLRVVFEAAMFHQQC
jgi:hypothetical protein